MQKNHETFLTPSVPGWFTYTTHVSHIFTVILNHHNLPTDYARELFKYSEDVASLVAWI